MEYPEDFKAAVKKVYPDPGWSLDEALDKGSEIVGRYLDDAEKTVSLKFILAATTLEEVQAEARRCQERVDLYRRWVELYQEQKFKVS